MQTAVDREVGAGGVAALFAGQPGNDGRDLAGFTQSLDRHGGDDFLEHRRWHGGDQATPLPGLPDTRVDDLLALANRLRMRSPQVEVCRQAREAMAHLTAEGGISVPAIVQLPKALRRQGIERGIARVDDLAPTFLEVAGIAQPQVAGKHPITGKSMLPLLAGKGSPHSDGRLAGELFGNAYYSEGNLKLLGMRPQAGFGDNAQPLQWQLFDLARDRGETTDLAAAQPGTVERLKAEWM